MKTRKLATMCLAVAALLFTPALFAGEEAKLPEGQAKASISVSGMTCGGCCAKIETAVAKLDGVVNVKADYEKGIATVVYQKDKVSVDQIVETINTNTSFKAKTEKERAS